MIEMRKNATHIELSANPTAPTKVDLGEFAHTRMFIPINGSPVWLSISQIDIHTGSYFTLYPAANGISFEPYNFDGLTGIIWMATDGSAATNSIQLLQWT